MSQPIHALSSAEEWTLWPSESGTFARYVLVAVLNRTRRLGRRLAAVFALLSCSCRAQTVGLHYSAGRAGRSREPSAPGNAAYARRSGPFHHGCLQLLGLDGPVSYDGCRVKPL